MDHDHHFTPEELHSLLAFWKVKIGQSSPLVGLPAAPRVVAHEELDSNGLLTEAWGRALRIVAAPSGVLRVLQPMPDMTAVRALYTDGAYDGLVGCWPANGKMRIGFPYTAVGELRDASAALTADFPAQIDPFRVELTVPGLAALVSAIDVLRRSTLGSILARDGHTIPAVTTADLDHLYAEGLEGHDARWLVTLFNVLMPMSVPLPPKLSADGVKELHRHRLLEPDGDGWRASPTLQRLTVWMTNPLPALAHEVVVTANGAPSEYRYLIGLRGCGPLWTIVFWAGDPPTVTLQSRSGSAYRRVLATLLQPLVEPPGAEPPPLVETAPPSIDRFCAQCGAAARPTTAFCTKCGAELPEA